MCHCQSVRLRVGGDTRCWSFVIDGVSMCLRRTSTFLEEMFCTPIIDGVSMCLRRTSTFLEEMFCTVIIDGVSI